MEEQGKGGGGREGGREGGGRERGGDGGREMERERESRYIHVVCSPEKTQHCPNFTGSLVALNSFRMSPEPVQAEGLVPPM